MRHQGRQGASERWRRAHFEAPDPACGLSVPGTRRARGGHAAGVRTCYVGPVPTVIEKKNRVWFKGAKPLSLSCSSLHGGMRRRWPLLASSRKYPPAFPFAARLSSLGMMTVYCFFYRCPSGACPSRLKLQVLVARPRPNASSSAHSHHFLFGHVRTTL